MTRAVDGKLAGQELELLCLGKWRSHTVYGVRTSDVVPMLHPVAIQNRHSYILVN